MFKRYQLTLLAGAMAAGLALLAIHAARAADFPIKVPAAAKREIFNYAPCTVGTNATPLSCSGFYVGAGLAGAGSNADIIGGGINGSVFAGGITPTFDLGYQYIQGNWIFAAELDAGYSVKSNASVNSVGNSFTGFRMTETFKAGGNLAALFGTQAPITVPPQLANSILGPYAHVGTTQWQLPGAWANGLTSGAGLLFDIGPQWFGDLRYTYTNFNGAKAGAITIQNDQSLLVTINHKF